MDAAAIVVAFGEIDNWLAQGGRMGKMVPIAFISSMRVLTAMLQMVLIPMDGIVMTVEFVQHAPDVFAEPEHTCDDDGRVEIRDGKEVTVDPEGLSDLDGA